MDQADEELYEKHADELVRFATGLVGPSDAEDVVAAAVVSCFSSSGWQSVRDRRAYLYRAVLNVSRRSHRSAMRREAREARSATASTTDDPLVRTEVLDAVARLTVRQRAIVVLSYWQDLEPEAIAERLAISRRTVYRDLATAHERLKELLR